MNEEKLTNSLSKFSDAIAQLEEACGLYPVKSRLERDGTIQRFEFTYELAWKCLKRYFEDRLEEVLTPLDALQLAYKHGIITDEQVWLEMKKDRNMTSHVYNQNIAVEIYERINLRYMSEIKSLYNKLKSLVK